MAFSFLKTLESTRFKRIKRSLLSETSKGDVIAIAGLSTLDEMFVATVAGASIDVIISNIVNAQAYMRNHYPDFTLGVVIQINRANHSLVLYLKDEGYVRVNIVDEKIACVERVIQFGNTFVSPTPAEEVTL